MAEEKTFSLEYVQELRQENAQWRTKLRDMETKTTELEARMNQNVVQSQVATEFAKRGIKADPSWLKLESGTDVSTAVDGFITEYPQFGGQAGDATPHDTKSPVKPVIPNTSKESQKTNIPGNMDRSLKEQKDDPKARAEIRDHYRNLLTGNK